jgi:hypothetical protein
MSWTSNTARVTSALREAVGQGLSAGGHLYANAVKRGLRGGYTSGTFVTGTSVSSVQVTPPEMAGGVLQVRVGTNLMYNLFWEIGHQNLFTGRFERVEVWRPALLANTAAIRERILTVASVRLQEMAA